MKPTLTEVCIEAGRLAPPCSPKSKVVSGLWSASPRRWWATAVMLGFIGVTAAYATIPDPGPSPTNHTYLDAWGFSDTNSWTSDLQKAPIAYTNLAVSNLGDGTALVVNSANAAWLKFKMIESDGTTNLCVGPQGSVIFWFAPNWSSTNEGGTGPGVYGRLIEAGSYRTNAPFGWWSLYLNDVGTKVIFAAQTNNGSGTTFLTAPIDWATNRWHHLALTYCSTNTALYIDGALVTNGLPLTLWPSGDALTNGFSIGSDGNSGGLAQAHGWLDDIATYNFVLNASTIAGIYNLQFLPFVANPMNIANLSKTSFYPTNGPVFDIVSGPGRLGLTNWSEGACVSSTNVWMTNATAAVDGTNGVTLTFSIQGSSSGWPWDVYATAAMSSPLTNATWGWLGRGYPCNRYVVTDLPTTAFVILGNAAIDSDGDGLPDAYELLVSHTDPHIACSAGDGIPDGWKILWGFDPAMVGLGSQDPDHDGLTNLQEYLWGTQPQVSEGLAVWVGTPAGFSSLP